MKLHHNTVHIPARSTWLCATDQEPWPCARRRAQLVEDSDGTVTGLRMVMMSFYLAAIRDLPNAPAGPLYLQLNGWIKNAIERGGQPS